MRAHAERHFALSAPADKDGKASYRETLQGLIARSRNPERVAKYQAELYCPPLPKELAYLWNAFKRIRRRIGSSGFGVNPITWPDIDAFCRHARFQLVPWELEIVEMLDDLYVMQHSKSPEAE